MFPEADAKSMNGCAGNDLGTCILRFYARHHLDLVSGGRLPRGAILGRADCIGLGGSLRARQRPCSGQSIFQHRHPGSRDDDCGYVSTDATVRRHTEINGTDLLANRGRIKRSMNGLPEYDWLLVIESKISREHRDMCCVTGQRCNLRNSASEIISDLQTG